METHEAIFAEIEQMREGAAALLRAKLDAMAGQIRDQANRVAGDLGVVVPPDLEALLPIASLAERLRSLAAPPPPPPPPVLALDLDVVRALDAGRAQSAVLQELLRQLGAWCGPRAIAVFRDGNAQGWSGSGFEEGNPPRAWHGTLAESPALARAAAGTPVIIRPRADAVLSEWFGPSDGRLLVVPMSLRGKVVGVLLALEGGPGLNVPMVQQVTYIVGLMLETLASRPNVPTPALTPPEVLSGEPEVPIEAPSVISAEAPRAIEEIPVAAAEATAPAEAIAAVEASAAVEAAEAPEASAAAEAPAAPEAPPAAEDSSETVQLKVPVTPVAPVAEARAPEDERKHEEARRFARLLVSEIRLYNEQAVQTGKLARDIYSHLREDIDRSRDMYEQRVSAEVRADSNYFQDEMVRILADGDADALGM